MIEFKNISKNYDDNSVISDLNLKIDDNELFVLVGPSGSGKTTTLKMINRLIKPNSGNILVDGKDITDFDLREFRLHTGYVLQNIALFPNMTICENVAIQLEQLKWKKRDIKDRVNNLLDQVGLDHKIYADRYPSELSGGEQQRVGIIRAISTGPKIILMDEPFSALDPISRRQLQDIIIKLHQDIKSTFVFVTHDMQEALKVGTKIAVMKDGAIQQVGTTKEILNTPVNDFVKSFFKDSHNLKNITAQYLVTIDYAQKKIPENEKFIEVSNETPVFELAQIFKENKNIKVGECFITIDNFLSFISDEQIIN
ncbi:ABC transporter ATP-binding protein [Companilactobacillus sp. DQM5]|uniref:ABC transporter ATP-binding protein n=1 Tax=Companilactobacillus sp. DQM5 TaxID=3463359 RepID=UPI0040592124